MLSGKKGDASVLRSTDRVETEILDVVVVRHVEPLRAQPEVGRARNHRYLPLASHAGEIASAEPSVTCFETPVSTFTTSMAL
jgi:hypothetical protein